MNEAIYIRRMALANQDLTAAMDRLSARFDVPREALEQPALRGDPKTRRLLELEHLVKRLDLLARAPVRDDAEERLSNLPEQERLPDPADTTRTPEQAAMHHGQPSPPEQPTLVSAGFPQNPGPPVLVAPNVPVTDAVGRVFNLPDDMLAEMHAAADEIYQKFVAQQSQDALEHAQENPPQTVPGLGPRRNPGAPVVVAPGQRLVGTEGQVVSVADEQALADQQVIDERAQEEAERLTKEAEERVGDLPEPKQHAVSPDNAGVPYLFEPGIDLAPVDQEAVTEAEVEREERSRQEAEDLSERQLREGRKMVEAAARRGGMAPTESGGESSDEDDDEPDEPQDALHALSMPQLRALEKAGYDTMEKIDAAEDDELLAIDGIGVGTVNRLRGR